MDGLRTWYRYFREYEHVAEFQKLCGVRVTRVQKDETVSDKSAMCACQKSKHNDLKHRASGTANGHVAEVSSGDSNMETDTKIEIKNYFLFYLFTFGASLGGEMFYLTFYPFTLWNIDSRLCRQLVLSWHILMYFGQLAKDFIKWPRPGPPAVKLEERFEMEYGMPSTHTIVGTCIPFSLLILTSKTYEVIELVSLEAVVLYVTGRPCGSVAQWSECSHSLREVLGSSLGRAMCFFLPCDI